MLLLFILGFSDPPLKLRLIVATQSMFIPKYNAKVRQRCTREKDIFTRIFIGNTTLGFIRL
jgi:hypothetical protein